VTTSRRGRHRIANPLGLTRLTRGACSNERQEEAVKTTGRPGATHSFFEDSERRSQPLPVMQPVSMAPGEPPPFWSLGPIQFQNFCRDLWEEQEGIGPCRVFGTNGQKQYGIDIWADRDDGDGIEVGQCKAFKSIPVAEIRQATNDFFKHWDSRWSTQNVRRFVLFVAGNVDSRQQAEEFARQADKFREKQIVYVVLGGSTLRNKVAPHPLIIRRYCVPADEWVSILCGEAMALAGEPAVTEYVSPTMAVLATQLDAAILLISDEISRQVESMRERLREGALADVRSWLDSVRRNRTTWDALPPTSRAAVLRLEALSG
jgi:hypothetical protein